MRYLMAVLLTVAGLAGNLAAQPVELPDIEDACWSVFIHDASPRSQEIKNWIDTDPTLSDLFLRQTRHYRRPADDAHYNKTLRASLGEPPLVALQTPTGGLIFCASGDEIADSPHGLAADIRGTVEAWHRLGRPETTRLQAAVGFSPCPVCPSADRPWRRPDRPPDGRVPDLRRDETAGDPLATIPWWVLVVAGGAAGLAVGRLTDRRV